MIIFSSRKLEQTLAAGGLSSWAKVKYIIVPAVVASLCSVPYIIGPKYAEDQRPMLNILVSVLCVIASAFLTYFGIKKCYLTNESLDKSAFFERFCILSMPPLAKLTVAFLPASIIALIFMTHLKDSHPLLHKRFPMVLSVAGPVITWFYYTMVDRSLRRFGALIQSKDRTDS